MLTRSERAVNPRIRTVTTVRPATPADIPSLAAIRAREWETEAYWLARIGAYLREQQSPGTPLPARAVFVAVDGSAGESAMVGFIAGHQTRRYGCDGELQWINVIPERRGQGIAGLLLVRMGEWFVEKSLLRICVDVEPHNAAARKLYRRFGADRLNNHWMVWNDARRMCAAEEAS